MRFFLGGLLLKFYLLRKKRIMKCRNDISSILFFKLYEYAFELFPDNTLKENSEISINVKSEILGYNIDPEFTSEVQEKSLKESALKDEIFLRQVSYLYLLVAFYCSGLESETLNVLKSENLEKARNFIPDCEEISNKSFGIVSKSVNSELKTLKAKLSSISKNRIDQERLKLIDPITISSSHVIFVISIFSTLFVVSGFAYNKYFFQSFDINVSDFFDLSDYLSSSIGVITSTTISTIIGAVFFFLGYEDALSKRLHAEQFDMEVKESLIDKYMLPFIVFSSAIGIIVVYLILNEILTIYLAPLVLIVAIYVLLNLPYWKYIKNSNTVQAIALSLMLFVISIGFKISDNVNEIKKGKYDSPYTLTFSESYKDYADLTFVSANSRHVFMWDSDINKMVVFSKDAVLSFTSK
ncbi:MAG: hypothetical protein ACJAS1_006092 [Oleiphilaceae bacterium]|jgi:hypothetical protein